MKTLNAIAVMLGCALLAGCGFGRGSDDYGDSFGGLIGGCLEATNDVASGTNHVVRIEFLDPTTDEIVFAEEIDVAPGEAYDVMDVPQGAYLVRAWFDDGTFVERTRTSDLDEADADAIDISPDLEAVAVFRHP